ncbi:Protein C, Serine peptidase, MEROPS family S49 [Paraburkholderia unamae]|uniref:S49 family peptidase n=1 Tax=Paraburkholderia unamae TaxID=219649 RepID=UPI001CB44CF3|nr:S49 family peptidase [Paraburkholderia unamae]CAG9245213.1 Protein C, Serine peptidase, MEROPS family S49 [Paraburkholderia unamae]
MRGTGVFPFGLSLLDTPLSMSVGQARALTGPLPGRCNVPAVASPACPCGQMPEGVAIIPVAGLLVPKLGVPGPLLVDGLGSVTGYDGIRASFALALADDAVRAVVFDIDSTGGEIAACLDLADLIYAGRSVKPVMAILSETALGTAYVLASACEVVSMPRTGRIGGLGVLVAHVDYSQALGAAGVKVTLISYGARKADGNDVQPLAHEARARIQADVDALGEMLVTTVARNRHLKRTTLRAMQAGEFLGGKGVAAGLADLVAAPDEAFAALVHELDVERRASVSPVAGPRRPSRRRIGHS